MGREINNSFLKKIINLSLLSVLFFGALSLPKIAKAAGASLYLAPGAGTYVVGGTFSVSIKLNTGGEPANAAQGTISFDNKKLAVTGISKGGSIFSLWTTEPSFNNSAGTISFGGGIPHPGYTGTAGQVFRISFKTKAVGVATVRFSSGAVLANDGKGTNILTSMGSGSYTVSAKVNTPPANKPSTEQKKIATPEAVYNEPKIKSETHPDQNLWYNKKIVKFNWELSDKIKGVSISFNQDAISDPGPKSDGLFDKKEYEIEKDGIWYLHLKFKDSRKWGTIADYRVMVDTIPPEDFDVEYRKIELGDWPELLFNTEDKLSGLLKYEIFVGSIDEKAFELKPEEKSIRLENLSVGKHTAMIKAIDKAGNERVVSHDFEIEPISTPIIKNYPAEIKQSDNFYMNGTAIPLAQINIYIEKNGKLSKEGKTRADANGNWFYISDQKLNNARYIAWVDAVNDKGIISEPSAKISFIVSPPIFAIVGNYIINYFTILVSLIFLIVIIIFLISLIIFLAKKKVKKETIEIEEVLHENISSYKKTIDLELDKLRGGIKFKEEKEKTKVKLKEKADDVEKSILKEVKDVEKLLK